MSEGKREEEEGRRQGCERGKGGSRGVRIGERRRQGCEKGEGRR